MRASSFFAVRVGDAVFPNDFWEDLLQARCPPTAQPTASKHFTKNSAIAKSSLLPLPALLPYHGANNWNLMQTNKVLSIFWYRRYIYIHICS